MVARDNGTWESLGQKLESPLLKEVTYTFSVFLARSETYSSPSLTDPDVEIDYLKGIVLRVWGGDSECEKIELLYKTELIDNTEWEAYEMEFTPTEDYDYLILEAFYKTPIFTEYNGHLLLDNCSDINALDN